MFIINEDNSHFFQTRQAKEMTRDGLQAFINQYAHAAVTHLFLCPNAMRSNFCSQRREAIWDLTGQEKIPPGHAIWPHNAHLLFTAGIDPYTVWIEHCRLKSISPWISMRMNDIHSVGQADNFMHASFWRDHPECWRVPHDTTGAWANRALNYADPKVWDYQMAFVQELFERYDPDGFELDWMRFPWHLPPAKEREHASVLTEFIRETHQRLKEWEKKRGHHISLSVRVPAHPAVAAGLGMDAVSWGNEGLIDLLVPCPFWTTADFNIPITLWRQKLRHAPRKILITPGFEHNARPWPAAVAVKNTIESLAGFAAQAWHQKADGVYLFNWMDTGTIPVSPKDYRELIQQGIGPERIRKTGIRIPVCFRDTVPSDMPDQVQLPVCGRQEGRFEINIGAKPDWGTAFLICGLTEKTGINAAVFAVTANGHPLNAASDLPDCKILGGEARRALRFSCPLNLLHEGINTFTVRQTDEDNIPDQSLVWIEFAIYP